MTQDQKKHAEYKNIYLVGGIISLFLVYMAASVMYVVHQVGQGSSADMLRNRLAAQKQEQMEQKAREETVIAERHESGDEGKC